MPSKKNREAVGTPFNRPKSAAVAAKQIVDVGEALILIGNALKDLPLQKAQRVIRAVAVLHGINLDEAY
jgi:hypothetical protein